MAREFEKYSQKIPGEPIELGHGPVELTSQAVVALGAGVARLELRDRERVVIDVQLGNTPAAHQLTRSMEPLTMKFGTNGQSITVVPLQSKASSSGVKVSLVPRSAPITFFRDRRVRMHSAVVHVLNFPLFLSFGRPTDMGVASGTALLRIGRTVLSDGTWMIEFQEVEAAKDRVAHLKVAGGNAITHVLYIKRADGRSFSITALEAVAHDLHRFLSFARGVWTSVFGLVGFRDDQVVYENWGSRLATPWESRTGWFDTHHGECLAELYPGFVKLLHDPVFAQPVNAALYWYLRSNRGGNGAGIDSGLILAQAALERLSLACLVAANQSTSGNAAAKLRAASALQKIPLRIPSGLISLVAAKRKKVVTDVPSVIVGVRNELVHPKRRLLVPVGPMVGPAWRLAQWYVELFLLRLSGYQGLYSNRIESRWIGEVERMPWTK